MQKQQNIISVYTSLPDFRIKGKMKKHARIYPYDALGDSHKEWILENTIKMTETPTDAERAFEDALIRDGIKYDKQVFFRINKHDYFLDFYIHKGKIAIEIDGSIHKRQKAYDKYRDNEFRSIDIRTIRIQNKDAYNHNIITDMEKEYKMSLRPQRPNYARSKGAWMEYMRIKYGIGAPA